MHTDYEANGRMFEIIPVLPSEITKETGFFEKLTDDVFTKIL